MSNLPQCINELIFSNAARRVSNALESEGRHPLTYQELTGFVHKTAGDMEAAGYSKSDRIALVLPNGPEMALAILSFASSFACAPLNPLSKAGEFNFYLRDLGARAVVVQKGCDVVAASVAREEGIDVIELKPDFKRGAGTFSLSLGSASGEDPSFSGASEIALLLYTSGTTSRPKLVPLTHANITKSAREVASVLCLGPNDRYLNILPLFHVHGIGMILASLAAGSKVACSAGFDPINFPNLLEADSPTWYSGTPSMHQAVLSIVTQAKRSIKTHLRFIRSASSPLPPSVMLELERVFGCPVIEAYGMTEAAHMIASNLLPPGARKSGSVGVARGDEVAIMDDAGNLLPTGAKGEIVICGSNVIEGYDHNPEATKSSFCNGWFKTGDQGHIDSDGYIYIEGRIKELINRGGEKISPREVEEVLLSLPSVSEAVIFAIPSSLIGEDVAAVVKLRDGFESNERELRQALLQKISNFKVPSRILILKDIPKSPIGKIQRIGMAERLGLFQGVRGDEASSRPSRKLPKNETEKRLEQIWCEVLKSPAIGTDEPFLLAGGDSLLASLIISRASTVFGVAVSIMELFDAQTIEKMAAMIEKKISGLVVKDR